MSKVEQDKRMKVMKEMTELKEGKIEGVLKVLPHARFRANAYYNIKGTGEAFDGIYKTKRVTHRLTRGGYEVEMEVRQATEDEATGKTSKPVPVDNDIKEVKREVEETKSFKPYVHTVVKGDTLWAISTKYTGKGTNYPKISTQNGIRNANLIYPGQKISIDPEILLKRFGGMA